MQVLHRLENGQLVHEVAEDTPVEKTQLAGVEFIEKAATLLVEDAIEFIEISKEDAEVLSKVENGNFKVITDGSRFILKWDPYLHSEVE